MADEAFDSAKDDAGVAVIGGGAAGLMAGIAAARAGARTVVYERNAEPGRKIAIAGGGRCNFTNTLDPREFVRRFGDRNAARLGHALRAFSRDDLVALLARRGVEGEIEKGYRIFAKSGRGRDVADALAAELADAGGRLIAGARVVSIERDGSSGLFSLAVRTGEAAENAGRKGVRTGEAPVVRRARAVAICTGGLSYPQTGSTGDGLAWARATGHSVTPLRAALVGLTVEERWPVALQGLAVEDALASLWPLPDADEDLPRVRPQPSGKPLCAERAELLFTHFGLSGPAILDVSNAFVAAGARRALLAIDFLPDRSREDLEARVLARLKRSPGRALANALAGLLPERLLDHLVGELGKDGQVPACRLTKAARSSLLDRMKRTTLTVRGTRGIEHGEVTAGGVAWDDLDPATLESRRVPGLFFAGEVLDVAGRCGGFNLQAAFSTGYLAGLGAARGAQRESSR